MAELSALGMSDSHACGVVGFVLMRVEILFGS